MKHTSKYDVSLKEKKEEELKDLIRIAKDTEDEILPLQTYLNMIKGQIKDIMKELNYVTFKDVTYKSYYEPIIDFNKMSSDFPKIIKYAVGNIDREKTLGYMYRDNVDYSVAKRTLEKAIDKTKVGDIHHEEIKIKN